MIVQCLDQVEIAKGARQLSSMGAEPDLVIDTARPITTHGISCNSRLPHGEPSAGLSLRVNAVGPPADLESAFMTSRPTRKENPAWPKGRKRKSTRMSFICDGIGEELKGNS